MARVKLNKKNDDVELLMRFEHLRLLQHPKDPAKIFPSFKKPLFKPEDGPMQMWQTGHEGILHWLEDIDKYTETTDYSKMGKVLYDGMITRAKKHVEFHQITDDAEEFSEDSSEE